MPEPVVLRLVCHDGLVLVTHGRSLVYRFDADDIGMRNLAIVALTDAGRRVDEVAAVFGLTATYVSRLRGRLVGRVRRVWCAAAADPPSCRAGRSPRPGSGRRTGGPSSRSPTGSVWPSR